MDVLDEDEIFNCIDDFDNSLKISDNECENSNKTRLYMQKFENKVDFSTKIKRQVKDKSDRATTDHALDQRSCSILFKMMNQQIFSEVNGCISTGKEANIYHVINNEGIDMVIKVYMTSIMPFKSRDKYVKGDFRMRHGYCKATSWKLVSKWAEKEYRNLIRINHSGSILVPKPFKLKGIVLLMSFIGKDGIPAPKLKDLSAADETVDWFELYTQVVYDIRTLFFKCRLVHADLSEYNLLYLDGKVWMIDVSQAVEHESPNALEYLRSDCHNVNVFFRKQGVSTLTLRELFEWVVNPNLPLPDDPLSHQCLNDLLDKAFSRGVNNTVEEEDNAFRFVRIPRNLSVSYPFVRDFIKIQRGLLDPSNVYYATLTGLKSDLTGTALPICASQFDVQEGSISVSTSSADLTDDEIVCNEQENEHQQKPRICDNARPRNESPNSRRERKKAVKLMQAEKRKHKIPKHIKIRKYKG